MYVFLQTYKPNRLYKYITRTAPRPFLKGYIVTFNSFSDGLPTSAMIKAQYRVVVCIFKNAIGTKILSQRNEKFDVYEAKKTLTHKRSIKLLQNKLFQ